jgi:hypothetical protein
MFRDQAKTKFVNPFSRIWENPLMRFSFLCEMQKKCVIMTDNACVVKPYV